MGWPGPMSAQVSDMFQDAMSIEFLGHDHYVFIDVPSNAAKLWGKCMSAITAWIKEAQNERLKRHRSNISGRC